jgi:hypothetical protein
MERRYYGLKAVLIVLVIVALSSMAPGGRGSIGAARYDAASTAEAAIIRASGSVLRATAGMLQAHLCPSQFAN